MSLPTFIGIGAPKSGSTSLYHYLREHPDVFMSPKKATNFFAWAGTPPTFCGPGDDDRENRGTVLTLEEYQSIFDAAGDAKARGEVSPVYFHIHGTAERIKQTIPDVKLIVLLRNPVEVAYSRFLHARRDDCEPFESFEQAIKAEEERRRLGWGPLFWYIEGGFYYKHLRPYFELFDQSQIKIKLYEEFKTDTIGVMQDIYKFIGANPNFTPKITKRYNESTIYTHTYLQKFLLLNPIRTIGRSIIPPGIRITIRNALLQKKARKPSLHPRTRRRLIEVYRDDIRQLSDLIERDLSAWYDEPSSFRSHRRSEA
ncbi:sulfotransferase family protein [Tautonia sociabilis]|nr:sulfotransferase [Tautonia sociabilis]